MKILGCALAIMIVAGGAVSASKATFDVYGGYNQISLPRVPMNLSIEPGDGLDMTEPYYAMLPAAEDIAAGGLVRFSAEDSSYPTYLVDESFGKLLLGDGYLLNTSMGYSFEYDALEDGVPGTDGIKTDMWISLPGLDERLTVGGANNPSNGGWHLIGVPYATDVPSWDMLGPGGDLRWRIQFTDGVKMKNWYDATQEDPDTGEVWVEDAVYGITATGDLDRISYDNPDNYTLISGKGYWISTRVDNLAMIITAE